MTVEDRGGWSHVEAADWWACPECNVTSPVESWAQCEVYCELCGDHDARQCPNPLCEEVFEHVWGAPRIQAANENRKQGS
jgi:hypothetical protein